MFCRQIHYKKHVFNFCWPSKAKNFLEGYRSHTRFADETYNDSVFLRKDTGGVRDLPIDDVQ